MRNSEALLTVQASQEKLRESRMVCRSKKRRRRVKEERMNTKRECASEFLGFQSAKTVLVLSGRSVQHMASQRFLLSRASVVLFRTPTDCFSNTARSK